MREYYSITELTREFDISTRTLRFYEDEGWCIRCGAAARGCFALRTGISSARSCGKEARLLDQRDPRNHPDV